MAYSDCPFSHRYIGSHTVPSRRILAVFDRFLPAVRTGRRQLTIYRFFIFAECFYGLSTDRENIPAGNLYFWGWLARNGIDCPMQISSRRDDKRRGGLIRPPLFFSSEYGVWKGVRHIQCKAIRKGRRNFSVRPPITDLFLPRRRRTELPDRKTERHAYLRRSEVVLMPPTEVTSAFLPNVAVVIRTKIAQSCRSLDAPIFSEGPSVPVCHTRPIQGPLVSPVAHAQKLHASDIEIGI